MSKPWDHINEQRLREMRSAGMRVVDIADSFNVPTRHIENRCKDLGIPSTLTPTRAAKHYAGTGGIPGGGQTYDWTRPAREASEKLIEAIRKAHPERVEARAA